MAGTLTPSWHESTEEAGTYKSNAILKIAAVGDSATGSFPSYPIPVAYSQPVKLYYLHYLDVVPQSPAPTALYDIAITDTVTGASMFVTAVENLSATIASRHYVGDHPISSFNGFTIAITNSTVHSAQIDLYFYFLQKAYW